MTATEYLLNVALVALVIRQLRGKRLTAAALLVPLGIVAWVATTYLHGIPTAGNDLLLALTGLAAGLVLGAACGWCTRVERQPSGAPVVRATGLAAALWVVGIGSRIGFSLYAQHGGHAAIAHFSAAHHITTGAAWVASFVLMALAEVVSRTAVLAWRAYRPVLSNPVTGPAAGIMAGYDR